MKCACAHDEKKHCKGGVQHTSWRPHREELTCETRHCNEPLCCCTNFVPAGGAQ